MKQTRKVTLFVPYNGKIADIAHADTDKHFLDLKTALSEKRKIIMVILYGLRKAGTGSFFMLPNEGVSVVTTSTAKYALPIVIKDGTQRLQYKLEVANDTFDLYCFGYVLEA